MPRELDVIPFDTPRPYADMLEVQRARRDAVAAGQQNDTLFLLEHTPVITLGRNAHREHLLRSDAELAAEGIDVCTTDRGGDVTYHGPGQLVAYPILDLNHRERSIGAYLRGLEQVIIDLLADYELPCERVKGLTGVWTKGAKIAAIGVGIHQWVTFHGVAINAAPNMDHFTRIVPCGIADRPVTSLAEQRGKPVTMTRLRAGFEAHFRRQFGY